MRRNINTKDKNSAEYLNKQYASARYALLMCIIFTALNLALLLDSQGYFLFSLSLPYYLTLIAMLLEDGAVGSYTFAALAMSIVMVIAYVVCWNLSKSRTVWLKVALALFCVDTVVLLFVSFALLEYPISNLMDFILHGIVIYEFVRGIRCAGRLEETEHLSRGPEL